jgi:hypothetical protein
LHLFKVTCDLDEAVEEITTFYRNYHSSRYVSGQFAHPPAASAFHGHARPSEP